MAVIYSPLLIITAFIETKQAQRVNRNRIRGQADDDTVEEWEQRNDDGDDDGVNVDFESDGWARKCREAAPNIGTEAAVVEIRKLKTQLDQIQSLIWNSGERNKVLIE